MRVTDEALRAFGAFVEVNLKAALAQAYDDQPASYTPKVELLPPPDEADENRPWGVPPTPQHPEPLRPYQAPRVLADVQIDDTQARFLRAMLMIDDHDDKSEQRWIVEMEREWLWRVAHVSGRLQSITTAVWCSTNSSHLPVRSQRVHLELARDHLATLMDELEVFFVYFDEANWNNIYMAVHKLQGHLIALETLLDLEEQ